MKDAFLDLSGYRQPLRALMYEKLIWMHLFGINLARERTFGAIRGQEFTYHQNGNIRAILGVIGFLVIIEGVAIDFFVATKSTRIAIVMGILHALMFLYTVALMRASSQRPVLVTSAGILIRTALLYCTWLPIASITSVAYIDHEVDRQAKPKALWCALGDQPNVCILLSKAEVAILPFGLSRLPSEVYLYLDKPLEFVKAVETLQSSLQTLT